MKRFILCVAILTPVSWADKPTIEDTPTYKASPKSVQVIMSSLTQRVKALGKAVHDNTVKSRKTSPSE